MCGITGIYNYSSKEKIDHAALKNMCDIIIHRGPDEGAVFIDQGHHIGLGHRRLSIIDLTTGSQPMSNANESIWIVFNGEIYNYPELKKELIAKGYKFRTTSDTEVIIYLYEEYGESAFYRLNGIFAFAIFDKTKNCLVLARDHFGVKPLYYSFHKGNLLFGSEIKTIISNNSFAREMDFEALNSFLTFRYNPAPQTLFKNIKKLYAGHYLKISLTGEPELKSFWNYSPEINSGISEKEAIAQYQGLLESAVKRQMISDVPVGLLLSGGVDSAVIGHLMQSFSKEKIKTFTIGFAGKGDFNELADARASAKYIGSEHFEVTISQKEYLDFFYKSFYYTEEPIAEMTIPALYYVSKLAASKVKVVLAGQGADEPLAGYKRYFGEQQISKYSQLLNYLPMQSFAKLAPRSERLRRAAYASQFTNEMERFLAIYTIFTPEQKEHLLNKDVKQQTRNVDLELIKRLYDQASGLKDSLAKILFIDTRKTLADNLLLFGDKITMANSLEMRVPFLDVELIKFVETLPSEMKLKGGVHKYIHKTAVKKWLPDEIIYRKKRGFSTPMDTWLQTDFAKEAGDLFNDSNSACRKYFNIEFINEMLNKHQNRKENFQRNIFALLSFEIWHKTFFERNTF
jgi:asparagine synthase (glutamine-hydrolysing)